MSDPWVRNVQYWIRLNYNTVEGLVLPPEDGMTGWPTIESLIMVLQHELGITSLSDSFGPTTTGLVAAISPLGPNSPINIRKVVQAACYCKGYDAGGGNIDGDWATIGPAIAAMKSDLALPSSGGTVEVKLLKSLLSMDAYVLVGRGSPDIRSIQRSLNLRYSPRQDFAYVPTDGVYSRNTQQGMMYALQYELDLVDGVANGNFGPTTRQRLRDYGTVATGSSDGAKYFVHLFQAALRFNGFPTPYSGNFTADTATVTRSFQQFAALPVTGQGDFLTWASLLISTGDTDRPGKAVDTATKLTLPQVQSIKAAGYEIIGRYLTNEPGDDFDKALTQSELNLILSQGMRVFPIFQEGGNNLGYFTRAQGFTAGQRAVSAAHAFGFQGGTTIYFAVDFDAVEDEVHERIVPYFEGVNDAVNATAGAYRVGVYGARNTCSIVSARGLAVRSFVSGMSTGFSGNLGFPLPVNWSFDQILEYSVGSGSSHVAIDKNIVSGRDNGQSAIVPRSIPTSLDAALPASSVLGLAERVAAYMRLLPTTWVPGQPAPEVVGPMLFGQHDGELTYFARQLGMRKALFATLVYWEWTRQRYLLDDGIQDHRVEEGYAAYKAGTPWSGPTDSSTGIGQMFGWRACSTINWARSRGFSTEPFVDENDFDERIVVWRRLRDDMGFAIRMTALHTLENIEKVGAFNNRLGLTAAQIKHVLSLYQNENATGPTAYGSDTYGVYAILEAEFAAHR